MLAICWFLRRGGQSRTKPLGEENSGSTALNGLESKISSVFFKIKGIGMNFILTCQISLKTGPGVILIG